MGGEWMSNDGYGCNIPVEYMYANDGYLWYAEYDCNMPSGTTFTMFIETKNSTVQGSICATSHASITVKLYELPADGTSHASIPSSYDSLTAYNLNRVSASTLNRTKIRLDTSGKWVQAVSSTTLQTWTGGDGYPIDSVSSRAYWKLNSTATYALVVTSGADDNHVLLSYTWNETNI